MLRFIYLRLTTHSAAFTIVIKKCLKSRSNRSKIPKAVIPLFLEYC